MSDSAELLGQMVNGDYDGSSQTLLHMTISYGPTLLRDSLQMIIEELAERGLVLRDHVTRFLGMQPLYFALQLSSPDMMLIAGGAKTIQEARSRVQKELLRRISAEPDLLDSSRVDVAGLANSEWSVILPHVLQVRADQMRCVSVPSNALEGASPGPSQFSIDRLWLTAYGRMILRAVEIPSRTRVVGSREWPKVRRALSEAGFDPEVIVRKIPYAKWVEELKSIRADAGRRKPESAELQMLDDLFWALDEIAYSNDTVALTAIEVVARSASRAAVTELMARAAKGAPRVRERALEALVECGGLDCLEFLESLLDDKDDPVRSKVAEALSLVASRQFARAADLTVRGAALAAKEIPAVSPVTVMSPAFVNSVRTLLGHSSALVRSEGSKVLLSLDPQTRGRVMDTLSTDRSTSVRFEVLSLAASLPEDDARTIIVRGMKDESERIRKLAAGKGNQLEPQ